MFHPDMNAKDGLGMSFIATAWDNVDVIRVLLDAGSSWEGVNSRTAIDCIREYSRNNVLAYIRYHRHKPFEMGLIESILEFII